MMQRATTVYYQQIFDFARSGRVKTAGASLAAQKCPPKDNLLSLNGPTRSVAIMLNEQLSRTCEKPPISDNFLSLKGGFVAYDDNLGADPQIKDDFSMGAGPRQPNTSILRFQSGFRTALC